MKIAVEGCMHGDLDKVYDTIKYIENTRNIKIDLLLCYGDFQFPRFLSVEIMKASNYLWELYYGGWAAPNIYFLGYAVVVKFGNIRIDGLSGIYNARNYCLGHHEMPPYNDNTIRSVCHVREYDVHKLMLLEKLIDIFLSHDWPLSITDYGNWQQLIQQGTLGIKPAAQLLKKLRPSYWFSAHLHCKFTALVEHEEGGRVTKFLALNKCLPGRKFLQVSVICRRTKLDMQDCCQWVKSRMEDRGAKPCEFSQTAPPHKPFDSYFFCGYETLSFIFYLLLAQLIVGSPRNPQIVSFLELLDLPYVLDNASDSRDTPSLPQKDDYSEDIPNEDEIDLADDAERNN
ncbi:hypothetical protein ES319_D08G000100v1 [Gossypium barbadense]|uniref:Lariat debranching enzyme C-terminal domain-containing protein n=1 Tax=Gossypium barbadense TaxID=3634 RepID=A0A5J5Q7J5_GOSBA|nr:hypothetical protein ES319_D08G000100v1 [Gossypium barbadense]